MKSANELRAELAAAETAERDALRAREKAANESFQEFMSSHPWEYTSTPQEYKRFLGSKEPGVQGTRIMRRLDPAKLAEWEATTGHTFTDACNARRGGHDNNKWHGMFYYRTDENILTHDGGGTYVLRDPKLCSDEEWALILTGNIPAKFKE